MMWQRIMVTSLGVLVVVWVFHVSLQTFITDPFQTNVLEHKHLPTHFHHQAWLDMLVLHVVSSCIAMLTGFIGLLRPSHRRFRRIHRANGYVYMIFVVIAVLSAGYLAPNATGGWPSSLGFNTWEGFWLACVILALLAIRKRNVGRHQRVMIRGYAMAFVNTSVHVWLVVLSVIPPMSYTTRYVSSVWLAGISNLVFTEIMIRWLRKRTVTFR